MVTSSLAAVASALPLAAGWGTHGTIMRRQLRTARRDPVTSLPTRAAFTAEARRLLARRPQGAAVLLIDLDEFKAVNDQHGHAAGDAVLAEQARRLAEHFAGRGVVGRLGGDEFAAVVYPGNEPPYDELQADLAALAVDELPAPIALPDGAEITVRGSVGAAVYAELAAPSLSAALHVADLMAYDCKRLGSRWFIARPGLDPRVQARPVQRQRHHGPAPDQDAQPVTPGVIR